MKSYLSFLVLFSVVNINIAQTYSDYTADIDLGDLIPEGIGGGGGVSLSISNNILTFSANGGFGQTSLISGNILFLDTSPTLPNMNLGYITEDETYFASIQNGYLVIDGSTSQTGLSFSISVDLASPPPLDVPDLPVFQNYYNEDDLAIMLKDGNFYGGTLSLRYAAGRLELEANIAITGNTNGLRTGNILFLNTDPPLPKYTIDLGPIGTINNPDKYHMYIVDGYLNIQGSGSVGGLGPAYYTIDLRNNCKTTSIDYSPSNIKQTELLTPETNRGNVAGLDAENRTTTYSYFDGLGRPLQTVVEEGSPNKKDVVSRYEFDEYGRQTRSYLPYVSSQTNGAFKTTAIRDQCQYYRGADNLISQDENAYSITNYERSPTDRVLSHYGAGEDWQFNDKGVKYEYHTNSNSDEIFNWGVNIASGLPQYIGNYTENRLYKSSVSDEGNRKSVEYTDLFGNTILKRVQVNDDGSDWAETYYVYDKKNNLRFVLPPEAMTSISIGSMPFTPSNDFLNKWAFQYKYDGRNRMIEKKVPGADKVYMIYDDRDRLVLTQDGVQRSKTSKEWLFTKYDHLNRVIATGTFIDAFNRDRATLQQDVNSFYDNSVSNSDEYFESMGGPIHGYTNNSFPKIIDLNKYLTITYYDKYDFLSLADYSVWSNYEPDEINSVTSTRGTFEFPSSPYQLMKDQITGTKTKIVGSTTFLLQVNYYDNRYRLIQSKKTNALGGSDVVSNLYSFSGRLLKTKTKHISLGGDELAVERRFVYDHSGRLLEGYHRLFHNSVAQDEVLIAANEYNELGELVEKNLHVEDTQPFQSVDYRYNVRGWLRSINSSDLLVNPELNTDDPILDYFGMEVIYNGNQADLD